ncbi:MazG-like nucleotide pyrophosphohydrolase [Gordonia phage Switzerland]|uniref:MazG-like pyrophosphatase n=1 Tax=Gordonia phage Rosalind TaxID=1838077 RepID=UPI0007B62B35|nr:MazG-like pyrophosphatase [Gordonia phage Rosalind]ASZ73930.1 MazG-like nucleotide pyrophosphohydrolase [Gordonia phage ShayRa]QFP95118.1 MazG-like nucleotide pyrophosphohydrolase [Gordonia phage MinecraftSteve]QWS67834.1 MazG-like nucleotide pyrophosphohydrolase [Gordonia phage DekHockey33]UOK18106.1 MazG-like nucleotide pyrophosphohydrolase [Gordonia phage Switzerland]ANA87086.1 MazG-like nucleotide pyrophosphohydrolase [Gordonia phage Rosalind]
MQLDTYQTRATATAFYPGHDDGSSIEGLSYVTMGLVGEAGEIANKVKKIIRDNGGVIDGITRTQVLAELGDVLWYVALIAEQLGYPLHLVAAWNLQKLADRAERGVLEGSGDNR